MLNEDKSWELTKSKIEVTPEIWIPKPKKGTGFEDKTRWDRLLWLAQVIGAFAIPISFCGLITGLFYNYQMALQQQQMALQQQQLTYQQEAASSAQTQDQERQTTLNTYLDDMSNLLLTHNLQAAQPGSAVLALAIARTDTALRNLDGNRKGTLVRFLWEAKLINEPHPIISLNGANLQQAYFANANLSGADLSGALMYQANFSLATLSGADLSGADLDSADLLLSDLRGTNLSGAILYRAYVSCRIPNFNLTAALKVARDPTEAHPYPSGRNGLVRVELSGAFLPGANLSGYNLRGIDLRGADLYGADLVNANLYDANLSEANLSSAELDNTNLYEADLSGAQVTKEQLAQARSLKGAIMPDGSKHP